MIKVMIHASSTSNNVDTEGLKNLTASLFNNWQAQLSAFRVVVSKAVMISIWIQIYLVITYTVK